MTPLRPPSADDNDDDPSLREAEYRAEMEEWYNAWPPKTPERSQYTTGITFSFLAIFVGCAAAYAGDGFTPAAIAVAVVVVPALVWFRFVQGWVRFELGLATGVAITLGLGLLVFGLCVMVVAGVGVGV